MGFYPDGFTFLSPKEGFTVVQLKRSVSLGKNLILDFRIKYITRVVFPPKLEGKL
jgi:hypothetical protein